MDKRIFIILVMILGFALLLGDVFDLNISSFEMRQSNAFDLSGFGDRTGRKSAFGAMAMSAVLPGAGQMYLGQNTKGGIMMATEMLTLFSLYRFNKEVNILTDDFKLYAYANAGLRKGVSDDIYKLAHNWRSSEEYHDAIHLWARERFLIMMNRPDLYELALEVNFLSPEDAWAWEQDAHFWHYRSIRRDRQNFVIYRNFAVGAMIVNRVISTIDSAVFANRLNNNNAQLFAMPDFERNGVTFFYEVKF